jgi:tungstate transport system substrate-binding protein
MLATINIAAERNGYTMTDRGTYIKYADTMKGNPPLKVLVEQDKILLNQYSVLAINPQRCPKAKIDLATAFSDWLAGAEAQGTDPGFQTAGQSPFRTQREMMSRMVEWIGYRLRFELEIGK